MEAVFLRAPGRGGVGIEKGLDPFLYIVGVVGVK
jgi:hypothetical protein